MDARSLEPRVVAALGLLGLLPVIWYTIGQPGVGGFVAALNVLIIVGVLWLLLGPVAESNSTA